jgi:acetyl/propionyl-CoA carboxylase alpha subunit
MGIQTVAVYSEADRHSPHVQFADEAILLGPPPSSQSYLLGEKIIAEAKKLGVDGIHPGYGFLSENAAFAKAVTDAGLTFIGPSPHSIEVMGSKLAAKEAVRKFDIPMVPGTPDAVADLAEAKTICQEIGYPVLIKASAGGGGKGMRIVEKEADLSDGMERAISEAVSSFGDGAVFIEKYVASPRHIEIQVLADSFGNTIHLFERECSVQRRHQKVLEEAPSSILTPAIRAAMGADAVKVAKACDYTGAGTVEFLLDENLNYYFLEMNTRLQVEHPVTEMISGVDLVEQQIRIARGERLAISQEDLQINGHALELRVYAEDPSNNFLPSIGKLEDGFAEGMDIPIFYDPMLAKLCVWAEDRTKAIRKMLDAIAAYQIKGPSTTLPFGKFVLQHEAFRSGQFDTHFVKKYFSNEALEADEKELSEVAALVALHVYLEEKKKLEEVETENSNWLLR